MLPLHRDTRKKAEVHRLHMSRVDADINLLIGAQGSEVIPISIEYTKCYSGAGAAMRCVVKLIDACSYPYTGDLRAMHQEIFAATRRYRNFGETKKYSHRKQICQMMRGRVRKSKHGTTTWYGRTTARSGQQ